MKYNGNSKVLCGMTIIGNTVIGIIEPIVIGTMILGIINPRIIYKFIDRIRKP